MTKNELRKRYRKERDQLNVQQAALNDQHLLTQLKSLNWTAYTFVHVFIPISRLKEPNIWPIVAYLKANYPAIQIVLSRSDFNTGLMQHYCYQENMPLRKNSYGIWEPEGGEEVHPAQLDLLLIPLLVCDLSGNRVGYGKGFYDRFLADCQPSCFKLGISYFEPVPAISDVEKHDVPLDACLVNNMRYDFSKSR